MLHSMIEPTRHRIIAPLPPGDDRAFEQPEDGAARARPSPSALTILAHDLRGPLASLRLLNELIESHGAGQGGDRVISCAARANSIIDGLEELLESVLDRARAHGDPLGFEPGRVDLQDVILSGIAAHRPMAEARDVTIACTVTAPVHLRGDGRLLQQVVENLIGNAIRHSGPGMTVTCSVVRTDAGVVLSVRDTGDGMSRDELNRIFAPFRSLSSRSKGGGRSFGLGLWIARLIAEQHGGRITASSAGPGMGSTLRVFLPLAAADSQD